MTMHGDLFVITIGTLGMPTLCAVSLDTHGLYNMSMEVTLAEEDVSSFNAFLPDNKTILLYY